MDGVLPLRHAAARSPLCEARGDAARARALRAHRAAGAWRSNARGWDGAWYRRAYYDDGTPLGSAPSDECRIDALPQAWAVISGAARRARARAGDGRGASASWCPTDDGLIRLLTPPFDRTPHDPGYIKGYVPGVRENGGQYTHAALWVVQALAGAGPARARRGLLEMLAGEPRAHAGGGRALPGRALRGRGRRLRRAAARRPRRLDLVHRLYWGGGETAEPPELRWRLPGGEPIVILMVNPSGAGRRVVAATPDGRPVELRDGGGARTGAGRPSLPSGEAVTMGAPHPSLRQSETADGHGAPGLIGSLRGLVPTPPPPILTFATSQICCHPHLGLVRGGCDGREHRVRLELG